MISPEISEEYLFLKLANKLPRKEIYAIPVGKQTDRRFREHRWVQISLAEYVELKR